MTSTEINNDFFTIERSIDTQEWITVDVLSGAGNSNQNLEYSSTDDSPVGNLIYYRLTQTDYDGKSESFKVVAVMNSEVVDAELLYIVNMAGQIVDENYNGIVIEYYSDNTTEKKFQVVK